MIFLVGYFSKLAIMLLLGEDTHCGDPVQQKVHLVGQVYSVIMNQTVRKIEIK